MDGNVQQCGFQIQKHGGQLLPGGDLNGQAGQARGAFVFRHGLGLTQHLFLPPGADGGELVQHVPAHGVDGGSGDNQAGIHPGAHLHAPVGRAAGLGDPLGEHRPGEGNVLGAFRHGAVGAACPTLRVGGDDAAAVHGDHGLKADIHKGGLPCLIGLPGGLKPFAVVVVLLPHAEHFGIHPACIVAVGEALTVEGGVQGVHHGLGDGHLVQRLAVDGGDGGHVFRPLHPAFQLQRDHAHFLQLPQIGNQAVVFQTQGVFFLPVGVAVALAAGLGAAAPVAGAAADHGGHVALAGIAHAQRAMDEDFNFNGRVGADVADFLPAQLPAENDPLDTHGGAQQHAGQRMDGHLGAAVDGNAGGDLTAQLHHA